MRRRLGGGAARDQAPLQGLDAHTGRPGEEHQVDLDPLRRKAPQHVVDIGQGPRVVALVAGVAVPVHQLIEADPDPLEAALTSTADEAKV